MSNSADELSERLYGSQAAAFDARRGLADVAPESIARALVQLRGDGLGRVLELGAGTGEIGAGLAKHAAHYVGLESSLGMAERWRDRFAAHPDLGDRSELQVRDGNLQWPVERASVDLVFASRSVHWLDPGHVRDEFMRVGRPGACFVLGRVVRGASHPRRWLRQRLHDALRRRGFTPKDGPRRAGELLFEIAREAPGSRWIPRQAVLEWNFAAAPSPILEGWRDKPSLAGLELPERLREEVLDEVTTLANQRFGALETELACGEHYAIEGVQLPPVDARPEPVLRAPFPLRLASRFGPEIDPSDNPPPGNS